MIIKTLKVILTYPKIPSIIDQTIHGVKIVKGRVDVEIECVNELGVRLARYDNITLSSQNRLAALFNNYPIFVGYKDGKLILGRRY